MSCCSVFLRHFPRPFPRKRPQGKSFTPEALRIVCPCGDSERGGKRCSCGRCRRRRRRGGGTPRAPMAAIRRGACAAAPWRRRFNSVHGRGQLPLNLKAGTAGDSVPGTEPGRLTAAAAGQRPGPLITTQSESDSGPWARGSDTLLGKLSNLKVSLSNLTASAAGPGPATVPVYQPEQAEPLAATPLAGPGLDRTARAPVTAGHEPASGLRWSRRRLVGYGGAAKYFFVVHGMRLQVLVTPSPSHLRPFCRVRIAASPKAGRV